ncbi:MAG: hypothetical protein AAGF07_02975 [Patescibacteria group bacterium]
MTNTSNLKQQTIEALIMAESLEQLPSGKFISVLKLKLKADKFVEGIAYIAEFVIKAMLEVVPEDISERMDTLSSESKHDELANLITMLIATNSDAAQAADNGLNFSSKVIAKLNNIELS